MNKFFVAVILVLLTQLCHSNEWIPIGDQPKLRETSAIEIKIWKLLEEQKNYKFEKRNSYRFQYSYIDKSIVLINAICFGPPDANSAPSEFDGPTSDELKISIYQVKGGGSCYFHVEYNLDRGSFTSFFVNSDE